MKFFLKHILFEAMLVYWGYYGATHNFGFGRICLGVILTGALFDLVFIALGFYGKPKNAIQN
jgi:hypothetical protein